MNSPTFNAEDFKAQFPALKGSDICYLDNAATTQKPFAVIEAISQYYQSGVANAHRGSHRLGRQATDTIETCRQKTARFINAASEKNIVFTQSCTAALNTIANGLAEQLQPNDEIILSELEHHANLVPWQTLAKTKNLKLKFIPQKNGQLDLQSLGQLLSPKTRVLSITACSNTLGSETNLNTVKKALPNHCLFIVDAAQQVAHCAIDVQSLDCDFLCFSAHKMYGPDGLGILYGKSQHLDALAPLMTGGGMIEKVESTYSTFLSAPHRFEAGSPATAAIKGFHAALDFVQQWTITQRQQHTQSLCLMAHQGLEQLPQIDILSQADNPAGIVCFSMQQQELNIELADFLDRQGIAIRQGQHCTQPLLRSLKRKSLLRASIAPYNNQDDINAFLQSCGDFIHHQKSIESNRPSKPARKSELDLQRANDIALNSSWQKKQKQIILWGKDIARKEDIRIEHYIIPGCESTLWLQSQCLDQRWYFRHDSDARLIRGLAALILSWVEGLTTQEINHFDFSSALDEMQLRHHLSPSRSNGIYRLIEHVQALSETK